MVSALLFLVCACDSRQVSPHLLYRADFDAARIDEAERVVRGVAEEWELRVFEKDRDEMAFLTRGRDAFFVALYFEGDSILVLTNVGVGDTLELTAFDYKKMPMSDLDALVAQVITSLEDKLDVEFKIELDVPINGAISADHVSGQG